MSANETAAKKFCNAIKELSKDENALENLELYLSHHFDKWLQHFASTPEGIAEEMQVFSEMYCLPF